MSHEKLIAHISAFLKERDEATRDDERDDAERKASAQCIARVVFKALEEPSEEMIDAAADVYHLARDQAVAHAKARNDAYERDGKPRIAKEIAVPNDWLTPVWLTLLGASPLATKEDRQ